PDQIANTPMTDYSLKDLEDSLKLLGDRTAFNDEDELVVEWSGSGFEVDVLVNEEGSDLRLGVRCNYASRWSVFVDGVRWGEKITVTTGNKEQIIARAIPAGEHTIRLVKESQPNTSRNNYNNLHSFDFNGKVLDTTDTEDKELFFEFIGDGYFVGLGNAGTSKNASGNKILDETEFTKSLPYLVAQEFDSDYSVVAHSEIGLITQAGSFSIEALHGNQNAFRDLETYYEAERIPDVIFIHVGLDDTAEDLPAGEFIVQAELYVEGLRRLYGEDVPVVWLYNAMSVANRAHEITALEKKMGEGSGFYAFKCEFGNSGTSVRGSHRYPSAEEHQKSAELLIPFVKDILAK
ncbi:MAG: hypothetical protein IKC69_00090, partial [Clostridia bacterium]|nr:hypothetical protein [Clostridia bacterium]